MTGQYDVGALPYAKVARAIDLLATEVAPVVRAEPAGRTAIAAGPQPRDTAQRFTPHHPSKEV